MPATSSLRRVKAADIAERAKNAEEAHGGLFDLLRRAKLFDVVTKIKRCGLVEQQLRCGCGAGVDVVQRYCHHYLCPMCQRYKAGNASTVVKEAIEGWRQIYPGLKVFFGTFTLPSCVAEDVSEQIDRLNRGFTNIMRRAALRKHIIGVVRMNEFHFNRTTGLFQPHIHALIVMRATYVSKGYQSREALLKMWQRATRCPRATQVNLKMIKPDPEHSLSLEENAAGMVRYAMKPISPTEWTPASLTAFSKATRNRRLCEFLGGFKPIMRYVKENKPRCICQACRLEQAA